MLFEPPSGQDFGSVFATCAAKFAPMSARDSLTCVRILAIMESTRGVIL